MAGGKIVSSLSWLPTHLVGSLFKDKYTLGQIVVDIIFAAAIACVLVLTRGSKKIFEVNQRSSKGLLIGIIALLLWYLLTIIDLFLHEARIAVQYNYFFIEVPLAALQFCAEGFLVATTYRIVVLHLLQQTRKAKIALILGEVLNLTLIITALYSIGSLVARQIVWLQLADEKARNGFARPQRRFEAAFYGLQFCMGLLATGFAGLNLWGHYAVGDIASVSRLVERQTFFELTGILQITHKILFATFSLWIWCISETAFVVKYHLGNCIPAKNTGLARDTIFGLFMLIFLIAIAFDGTDRRQGTTDRIHLTSDLSALLAKMKAAARTYIIDTLHARANDNEKPPPFKDVVRDLRRTPNAPFKRGIRDERAALDASSQRLVDEWYREYVTELEGKYGVGMYEGGKGVLR